MYSYIHYKNSTSQTIQDKCINMESYEKISWEVLDPGTTVSRVILSVHITLGNRVMYAISGL